jgi:hypothetical protein
MECTIKDGGRAKWIQEKIEASPWRKAFEVKGVLTDAGKRCVLLHACLEELRDQGFYRMPMVLDKGSFEGALRSRDRPCSHGTVYRTHCLECGEVFIRLIRLDKEREVRVSPVLEQGFKTRPITVNHGAWGTLMHLPRLWLFAMLSRCAEIPSLAKKFFGWEKKVPGTVNYALRKMPNGEVNSLDLTAATDNFSKDLCASLYEGFTANCPPLIRELGRETFRPVTLIYRWKDGVERVRSTSRGILMGDPVSWSILNIHNIFLWRLADEVDAYTGKVLLARLSDFSGFKVPKTEPDQVGVVRCGDDQAAVAPPQRCRNFEALLNSVGAVISVGAHFASQDFVFYAKSIYMKCEGKFTYYDIFPTRFVTGPQRTRPGERQIPAWWHIGSATETGVSWFHAGFESRKTEFDHAFWVAGWFFRKAIRNLLHMGIEPFLPRELGGLGFVSARRKFIAITPLGKAVWDMLLRDDVSVKAWLLLHIASFVWSLAPDAKRATMLESATLFFRMYYPSALDGFSDAMRAGPDTDGVWIGMLGDPGNPLGIARDPGLPYSLGDAVSAFSGNRFPPYEVSTMEYRTPPTWRIAKRFREFAEAIKTPYRARKHELNYETVRGIIARANEWRCAKLPRTQAVESCPGFRKCVPTDSHVTREIEKNSIFRIDFVPSEDLQRILRCAGVAFPRTAAEAKRVVKENLARKDPDPVYFGTRIGSFNAILRAPPIPPSKDKDKDYEYFFDPRGVAFHWEREDPENGISEALPEVCKNLGTQWLDGNK